MAVNPLLTGALFNAIKRDVLGLVRQGKMPDTVQSLSEVGQYVDINWLGEVDQMDPEKDREMIQTAQAMADLWIKDQGLIPFSKQK